MIRGFDEAPPKVCFAVIGITHVTWRFLTLADVMGEFVAARVLA
jgi:hypothetical protein